MLRASAARAPLLCTECLQHLATSTRASSNSAFGSRVQDSPSSEDHARAPLGYSSRSSQRYSNNNGQSSSSYSSERYNGNDHGGPSKTRTYSADRPPRPQHLLKDWKTLTPMSPQAKQQQRREDGNVRNNNNNYRSTNQANHRFAPRDASSSLRQTGMRRDGPSSSSSSYGRNQQQQQQPAYQERNNRTPASDYGNYATSRSSPPTPTLGHRGNLKNQAAVATRYDATSISEKDKPKQVNFGQGSALAAFALKKNNSKGKEKETSFSSATANARPQQATSMQKAPLKPLARRKTRAYAAPKKIVDIPATVSVNALSQILDLKLRRLQFMMEKMGITDTRPDKLLSGEDASLVAGELGYQANILEGNAGFDIYASPPPEDQSTLPLRPPIVTIMGHVDHGKTSLLDALRSTKVAAGEAGGITQHIGAFNVALSSLLAGPDGPTSSAAADSSTDGQTDGSITFLDTPGHAAFAAMRLRGASVTDVVVLVVAADDGVKPQTEEVINLVKNEDVGLVVAITKCDKPGIDVSRVQDELFARGLEVESLGGDVPCVQVSAKSGEGLADLVETINAVAEVRDLRAEIGGLPSEGRIIESRVDKGKGNVTTVIVTRGSLKLGSLIIAGKAFARVRQLLSGDGKMLEEAGPGTPVEVTGWKILPEAGDTVLEAKNEEDAKNAIETRKRREERLKEMGDLEIINEKRRILAQAHTLKKKMQDDARKAGQDRAGINAAGLAASLPEDKDGSKILNLIIKADFNGTEEAVSNALAEIGNSEARVKIVETGVGGITDGDLALAKAVDGVIIGFNVKASRQILSTAQQLQIAILQNNVIYRLIEDVKERVISLLPKLYDQRVLGEGSIQQVFKYTVKGSGQKTIAGCRVVNGTLSKKAKVRIMRNGETIFDGTMASLKHHKEEVDEMRKGSDCGIMLEGFEDFQAEDTLQSYEESERKRTL